MRIDKVNWITAQNCGKPKMHRLKNCSPSRIEPGSVAWNAKCVSFQVGEQKIVRWFQSRRILRVINQFKPTITHSHCNHRLVCTSIVLVKQDSQDSLPVFHAVLTWLPFVAASVNKRSIPHCDSLVFQCPLHLRRRRLSPSQPMTPPWPSLEGEGGGQERFHCLDCRLVSASKWWTQTPILGEETFKKTVWICFKSAKFACEMTILVCL